MKKALLSLLASGLLIACNDVAIDDRYLAQESVEAQRVVLLEDFTGQNCVNCPAAHTILEKLSAQHGAAIIPVSIHAGGFGISVESTRYTGLMTPEGDTYNDAWGITEWPKGVVNRHTGALNPDEWATAVRTEIARPTNLAIDLDASLSDDLKDIDIAVTLRPAADIKGRLQVWILEDSIIAFQKDVDRGRIPNYVHNHVYRASVNGVGGEPVELSAMLHKDLTYTCLVRSGEREQWNVDNLSVVAFVYNDSEVLQAAKVDLRSKNNDESTN